MNLEEEPDAEADGSRDDKAVDLVTIWSRCLWIIREPVCSGNASPIGDRIIVENVENVHHNMDPVLFGKGESLFQSEVQARQVIVSAGTTRLDEDVASSLVKSEPCLCRKSVSRDVAETSTELDSKRKGVRAR